MTPQAQLHCIHSACVGYERGKLSPRLSVPYCDASPSATNQVILSRGQQLDLEQAEENKLYVQDLQPKLFEIAWLDYNNTK